MTAADDRDEPGDPAAGDAGALPRRRFPPALMAGEISRLQPLLPARIAAVRLALRGAVLTLHGPDRVQGELLVSLLPGALGLLLWDAALDGPLPPAGLLAVHSGGAAQPVRSFLAMLEGWRIERAFAPPREPVAVLGLSAPPPPGDRPGAGPWRTLIWELFGAAGNGVLISLEDRPDLEDHWLQGRVLRRLHPAHGHARSLEVGDGYRLPRAVEHDSAADAIPAGRAAWIDHLTAHWRAAALDLLRRPIEAERTRLHKKIGALRAQCADEATIARVLLEGQYLQAHPQRGKRGLETIDPAADAAVWNLTQPIALKPRLTVAENAAQRFDQAHKWRQAAAYAAQHLPPLEADLAAADTRLRALSDPAVQALPWPEFAAQYLPTVAADALPATRGGRSAKAAAAKLEIPKFVRRFESSDGFFIDVGKSARDNHQLTFKSAHGNDLLLHIAGVPGAHVILRCKDRPAKGENPVFPPATLLEAARLCLHFSSRKATGGEVVYAPVKHCRAGRAPGQVMIAHPKYIRVAADPAALQKILDRKIQRD